MDLEVKLGYLDIADFSLRDMNLDGKIKIFGLQISGIADLDWEGNYMLGYWARKQGLSSKRTS